MEAKGQFAVREVSDKSVSQYGFHVRITVVNSDSYFVFR